jgi:hypothetical protein
VFKPEDTYILVLCSSNNQTIDDKGARQGVGSVCVRGFGRSPVCESIDRAAAEGWFIDWRRRKRKLDLLILPLPCCCCSLLARLDSRRSSSRLHLALLSCLMLGSDALILLRPRCPRTPPLFSPPAFPRCWRGQTKQQNRKMMCLLLVVVNG